MMLSTLRLLLPALLLTAAMAPHVGAQAPRKTPTELSFRIANYTEPYALLAYHLGDQKYIKDTLFMKNGVAARTWPEGLPGGVYMLVLKPNNNLVELLVNEPKIEMSLDARDPLRSVQVKTSRENKLFQEFQQFTYGMGKEADSLQRNIKTLQASLDSGNSVNPEADRAQLAKARERMGELAKRVDERRMAMAKQNPNTFLAQLFGMLIDPDPRAAGVDTSDKLKSYMYFRTHYWDNVNLADARFLRTPVFQPRLDRYFDQILPQNPDTITKEAIALVEKAAPDSVMFQYVLVKLLNKYIESKVMGFDAIYIHLINTFYRTGRAWWPSEDQLKKMIERADAMQFTLLGLKAPDLTLLDPSFRRRSLYEQTDKYTILYFYSPSCGHCKKQTPKMVEVFKKYRDKGVGMFAVCTEHGAEAKDWLEFMKTNNMENIGLVNVANLDGKSDYRKQYDVYSTPVMFILDDKKTIIAKRLAPEQADQLLGRKLGLDTSTTPIEAPDDDEDAPGKHG